MTSQTIELPVLNEFATVQPGNRNPSFITIAREEVQLMVGIYVIMFHPTNTEEASILLVRNELGQYSPPGGVITPGIAAQEQLSRMVREQAGVDFLMFDQAGFQEDLFYFEPSETAIHLTSTYFRGVPKPDARGLFDVVFSQSSTIRSTTTWVALAFLKQKMHFLMLPSMRSVIAKEVSAIQHHRGLAQKCLQTYMNR